MTKKERLFDAFGELLYAIIHANQNIKDKNTYLDIVDQIARKYRITKHIDWSINYEKRNAHSLDNAYMRALMAGEGNLLTSKTLFFNSRYLLYGRRGAARIYTYLFIKGTG